MHTILSDLDLESPLVGTAVTAHVDASGPDGFRCTVYDLGTGRPRRALLPRSDAYDVPDGVAPPEVRPGDTLVMLVVGVSPGSAGDGDRLMLSAMVPGLVERILAGFVDEILTGAVVIKGIARVAGSKTKIAVAPTVPGIDARGACVGRGACRTKGAARLLNRGYGQERLEIIQYSADQATFLRNAMNPMQVTDVLVDGDRAIVAVEDHQMSGGIGEGGLNAELAGRLTGLYVRVVKAGTDLREAMTRLLAGQATVADWRRGVVDESFGTHRPGSA